MIGNKNGQENSNPDDFYIEYKNGKMNVASNALSRNPTISLMHVPNDWKSQLAIEYSKDNFACQVLDGLVNDDALRLSMI